MAQAKPSANSGVRINVSRTRYSIVRQVADLMNMLIVEEEDNDCDVYWIDCAVPLEKYLQLKSYQIINHFSGMGEISRKDLLAKNIQKMKHIRSDEYNIIPMTWILPAEHGALSHFMSRLKRRQRAKTFIIKPPNSSMGNGISLARNIDQVPQRENVIVQEYIDKPLLLDGFKFDLRVYVLVTSCNPLRIFIYKDGLVRLSTQAYTLPTNSNLDQHFMHLTNYSINKHSEAFDRDEDFDKGSKRSLKYFNGWLIRNGYNVSELWARIHDVIIKTLIVAQPHLQHCYQACRPGSHDKCQCFEILGFDVLLDNTLRPWLLEVNRSPSFGTDSQLDVQIKLGVISDALRLVNIKATDKQRKLLSQRTASRRRLLQIGSVKSSRMPLDFIGEHEDAALTLERKKEEVKSRLYQLRQDKELENFEDDNMGDYSRIFPSPDPQRQLVYKSLLVDAARISFSSKTESRQSLIRGLEKMKEKDLLELLSQYESDERFGGLPTTSQSLSDTASSSLKSIQPLSFYESSPMEAELRAMAEREHEEEQTQRTMLALNGLGFSYPGKDKDEVKKVVEEVQSDWQNNRSAVGTFWLHTLDSTKRKQLLIPMREMVRNLLHTHWRTALLDSIRLNKVFVRLFNFFLANHGQGLWSSFPGGTEEHWEKQFRKKSDVLSLTEIHCCRRIVELVQATVIAAKHYYQEQQLKKSKSQRSSNPPSLLTRRYSDVPIRPPTVYATRRTSVMHLYGRSKSRSVPSVTASTSFPKIQSSPFVS